MLDLQIAVSDNSNKVIIVFWPPAKWHRINFCGAQGCARSPSIKYHDFFSGLFGICFRPGLEAVWPLYHNDDWCMTGCMTPRRSPHLYIYLYWTNPITGVRVDRVVAFMRSLICLLQVYLFSLMIILHVVDFRLVWNHCLSESVVQKRRPLPCIPWHLACE